VVSTGVLGLRAKAVLFDMGNTLVKYDYGAPEEVFQRVLSSLGISRSLNQIKKAFLDCKKKAEYNQLLSSLGRIKCEEYWFQWDAMVLKHLKIEENEELPRTIHSKWFDCVDSTLYPEVREVLLELKRRGMKVGLISTAYEEEIQSILRMANLKETAFDIIVGVDTIKKVKPNPEIFKYAISKLDVKPEEAIFVGDNVEADYEGAENAGLHALLIDRTEKQQNGLRTIKNLKEILSKID
jgi:HAD superfamily hydrolase (TIGR01662 family)